MRCVLLTLAGLTGISVIVFLLVVFGGLYDVSARDGHWPGVSPVLHSSFRSSVELRAVSGDQVPTLTDDMAALGAGHFDAACRFCHAAPGEERNGTVQAMVPEPPAIVEAVGEWTPAELGWIVREGVKMTGMPGWPSGRDKEVWPVVAFLTRVADMSEEQYRELLARPETEDVALRYCATCHGMSGRSDNVHIPRLDIQSTEYLQSALNAYRDGSRESGFMRHAATEVDGDTLNRLARHYADSPPAGDGWQVDKTLAARGRELAFAETDDGDVPACRACHGPWPDRLRPGFPSLAGQSPAFLEDQLRLWREQSRGGGPRHELMAAAAANLPEEDVEALAAYYASLAPARLAQLRGPGASSSE